MSTYYIETAKNVVSVYSKLTPTGPHNTVGELTEPRPSFSQRPSYWQYFQSLSSKTILLIVVHIYVYVYILHTYIHNVYTCIHNV